MITSDKINPRNVRISQSCKKTVSEVGFKLRHQFAANADLNPTVGFLKARKAGIHMVSTSGHIERTQLKTKTVLSFLRAEKTLPLNSCVGGVSTSRWS